MVKHIFRAMVYIVSYKANIIILLGERNGENEEVVRTKKRVVKEAFGSGSDSEGSGKERDSPKKRKRSESRRSSDSEGIISILIKFGRTEITCLLRESLLFDFR